MEQASSAGSFTLRLKEARVEGLPRAPDRGLNEWDLSLGEGAARVSGATLNLRTWMPDHGHGTTPNNLTAAEQGGGDYRVGPFDLFMGGFWEFTFTVTSGGKSETAKYAFCVEG